MGTVLALIVILALMGLIFSVESDYIMDEKGWENEHVMNPGECWSVTDTQFMLSLCHQLGKGRYKVKFLCPDGFCFDVQNIKVDEKTREVILYDKEDLL